MKMDKRCVGSASRLGRIFGSMAGVVLCVMCVASCGGGSTEDPALTEIAQKLDARLAGSVEDNPALLDSASAEYAGNVFAVKAAFADSVLAVKNLSSALVDYYTAQQLKANADKSLETLVNSLTKSEGKMAVTLGDVYGASRTYEFTGKRLRQLFQAKNSELSFQDVKAAVGDILASRVPEYKALANAKDLTFAISNDGFATYTFIFDKATNYASHNPGTLKGRYLKLLQPAYENFGDYRSSIEDMMKSLGIDGYRFVYTTADNTKPVKVTIPWRDI